MHVIIVRDFAALLWRNPAGMVDKVDMEKPER
jgi:hypothetical protein